MRNLFRSDDIRGPCPGAFSGDVAWKMGHAAALFLQRSRQNIDASRRLAGENIIIVGRDNRGTSDMLAAALAEGINSAGLDVIDIGAVDTPMVWFAVNHFGAAGGIQVTASDAPLSENGLKMAGPGARPLTGSSGLSDIRRIASLLRVGRTGLRGAVNRADLWSDYGQHLRRSLRLSGRVRVAVDAGGGMAAATMPAAFGDAGPLELTLVDPAEDGAAPASGDRLATLAGAVRAGAYDAGVWFDRDADRCVFVTETGAIAAADSILAMLACSDAGAARATVVHDVRCCRAALRAMEAAGAVLSRQRSGSASIAVALADAGGLLGADSSGRFCFRESFFRESPATALARVASLLSQAHAPLSALISQYMPPARLCDVRVETRDPDAALRDLGRAYRALRMDHLDGLTIDADGWRCNVRKADGEAALRVDIEADDRRVLDERFAEIARMVRP